MPKGSSRGSSTRLIKAKTWAGAELPPRTKAQLTARTKNMVREFAPKDGDATARKNKRDIRSDASVSRIKKMKTPVGKGGR